MSDSNQPMSGFTGSDMSSIKPDSMRNRISQQAPESNAFTASTLSSQQRSSNQYQTQSQHQPPSSAQYQPSNDYKTPSTNDFKTATPDYRAPPTNEYKYPSTNDYKAPVSAQYQVPSSKDPPLSTQYQPVTTAQHQPAATPLNQNQPPATQYQPSTQYQSSNYQTTPSNQYQPQTPQYQAPPPNQYQPSAAQPQVAAQPGQEKPERATAGMMRTSSVRQMQPMAEATPVMPSGKPVAKEVTITVTGKLPSVPSTPVANNKIPVDTTKDVDETLTRPQVPDFKDLQQRQFERPTNPPVTGQQMSREATPQAPQKLRPTDLTFQQERPVSRVSSKTPGTWCPKTGRFVPDPPDPRAQPQPHPPPPQDAATPTPRKPKGTYCPKTGRYIPPTGVTPVRKAMTPRGDEFRVKFAEIESETPRYLRRDQRSTRPSMAFGSVISTPRDQDKARVRRAKSTDGIAQRKAMTPRGDGKDFASSIENYESAGEDRHGSMVRSTSSRSSFRQPRTENVARTTDYRNITPRVSTFNDHYQPTGGVKKVVGTKLQWNAKSKVSSFRQPEERSAPTYEQRSAAQNETREYTARQVENTPNHHTEAPYNYPSNNDDDLKRVPRSRIK
ncbi:uncharacterized protein LOC135935173 [Cloeon dipterum]|uniref:uncharacterized protein LOC135935173 n=1 Tax=Cloeon dipterum TaxID=197152 RepID=UPI003220265A